MSNQEDNTHGIEVGMRVEVNPQTDRSRKILVEGNVAEILTRSADHPHGILVQLTDGVKGRVKRVITDSHGSDSGLGGGSYKQSELGHSKQIADVIRGGENHFAEFKTSALWSQRLTDEEMRKSTSREVKEYGRQASKIILAKTIAGFLNTDGGWLIIGVKENKQGSDDDLVGVESEYFKLNDKCEDGYRRMLVDSVIKPYFPSSIFNHIHDYINIAFEKLDNKVVCGIYMGKSDIKVFLRVNNQDVFYIRVDASTRQIHGEQIVDYCNRRFSN